MQPFSPRTRCNVLDFIVKFLKISSQDAIVYLLSSFPSRILKDCILRCNFLAFNVNSQRFHLKMQLSSFPSRILKDCISRCNFLAFNVKFLRILSQDANVQLAISNYQRFYLKMQFSSFQCQILKDFISGCNCLAFLVEFLRIVYHYFKRWPFYELSAYTVQFVVIKCTTAVQNSLSF